MGIAVNIEPAVGRKIAEAVKIEHKQPTYYNPISTRIQDLDEDNVEQAQEEQADAATYTVAEATEHNAQLDGAVAAGGNVPADYETKVGSAAGGATLTEEEANAYNATLPNAVKAGDKKPAQP
jgi:hypothetical protein